MSIQAVLFDLDNTLLNRNQAFQAYAADLIRTHAVCEIEEQADGFTKWLIAADKQGYAPKKQLYEEMARTIPLKDQRATAETLLEYWFSTFNRYAVIMEGAESAMRQIKARGVKLGLITNGSSRSQHAKIDQAGFRSLFDTIIVSDDVSVKKPDPAIFHIALTRLGIAPEQAVYVGDHPANDIDGAVRAGLRAIWLRGMTTGEPASIGRYQAIGHLDELHDRLFK